MMELVGTMFSIVWLIGMLWAMRVMIKSKNLKSENAAMEKLIRHQSDILKTTLNREQKLRKQMKEEKNARIN
jgi:hypothetical protein